jgi:sirohydrochlorin cobaltochelatase
MPDAIERALKAALAGDVCRIGQIAISFAPGRGFILCHRDDSGRKDLIVARDPQEALEIARNDESEKFRPLKTAPTLRRGWQLEIARLADLACALENFYPGRLAILAAWKQQHLETTSLRETLDRQTGMYRIAAKISNDQIDHVVGNFCHSDGGCLRTILWSRDRGGAVASTKLPPEKFDPAHDQTGRGEPMIPLLCQEPCNLLVAKCREAVKTEGAGGL